MKYLFIVLNVLLLGFGAALVTQFQYGFDILLLAVIFFCTISSILALAYSNNFIDNLYIKWLLFYGYIIAALLLFIFFISETGGGGDVVDWLILLVLLAVLSFGAYFVYKKEGKSLNYDDIYNKIADERKSKFIDDGLWVKAIALSKGNVNRTEGIYIRLRLKKLAAEMQESNLKNVEPIKKEVSGRPTSKVDSISSGEDFQRWKNLSFINKCKNLFYGRLSLVQYWVITLWYLIIVISIIFLPVLFVGAPKFDLIWILALCLIPLAQFLRVGLLIRRLHDIGKSGWWTLLMLVPPLNLALALGLLMTPGENTENKFGKVSVSRFPTSFFNKTISKNDLVRVGNARWHYVIFPLFLAFFSLFFLSIY